MNDVVAYRRELHGIYFNLMYSYSSASSARAVLHEVLQLAILRCRELHRWQHMADYVSIRGIQLHERLLSTVEQAECSRTG